jgi:hypothetical protein
MAEVAQPRRSVDGGADVIAFIAQLHLTGVHTDAQSDRRQWGSLQFQRTGHRVTGSRECYDEAVALTLLHRSHPAMSGDEIRSCIIQPCERGRHLVGLGFPQLRGAFDVGQQQRHGARG